MYMNMTGVDHTKVNPFNLRSFHKLGAILASGEDERGIIKAAYEAGYAHKEFNELFNRHPEWAATVLTAKKLGHMDRAIELAEDGLRVETITEAKAVENACRTHLEVSKQLDNMIARADKAAERRGGSKDIQLIINTIAE